MKSRDKLAIAVILIVSLVVSLLLASRLLPLDIVGGKTAVEFLEIQQYESNGAKYDSMCWQHASGTYKSYEGKDYVGIAVVPKTLVGSGWTQDVCVKMGGLWTDSRYNECYLAANHWGIAGLDKLEITAGHFDISCGGAWFQGADVKDMIMASNGILIPGLPNCHVGEPCWDAYSEQQRNAIQRNAECSLSGAVWVRPKVCTPKWQCSEWGMCQPDSTQARTCTDLNNCGTGVGKPPETQPCVYVKCGNGLCDYDETPVSCSIDCEPQCTTNKQCEDKLNSCDAVCTAEKLCDLLNIIHNPKQCPDGITKVQWLGYPQCKYPDCPPYCGNGICDAGETFAKCPADCTPLCTTNEECQIKHQNCDASCVSGECKLIYLAHPPKICSDGTQIDWLGYPDCNYPACPTEAEIPWIYIIGGVLALIIIIGVIVFIKKK